MPRSESLAHAIARFSVGRPVTVVTAFLVVLVVGILATVRIPLQMMPSGWDPPFLWIWAPYGDSSPVETEDRLLRPMEEQLSTIAGIQELRSKADADSASVSLRFHTSVSMDEAYNAAVDRLERAMPLLPEDLRQTFVFRFDPNDQPIVWAGISIPPGHGASAHVEIEQLVQKRLSRIPGVGRVEVWGVDDPVVAVEFDREAVLQNQVNLVELLGKLNADTVQVASGQFEERGRVYLVRGLSRFTTIEDIRAFPVKPGLTLRDVASVEIKKPATASINRINGQDGAALAINKEGTANTIEVCREVMRTLTELEAEPRLAGYRFPVFFNQGDLIQDSVDTLLDSAWEGGILAVLTLILFLREWRITALISATIPASLLAVLIVMYFRGDSLNLLSMLGLMLAVGMIVDNAVVVVESIYRRRQGGQGAVEAAVEGTAEVMLPIVLSTLTSIVVFLPIILMSEDASFSFFMGALGLPVVFLQLLSLVITLLFTPLSTVWLAPAQVAGEARWVLWLGERVDRGVAWMLKNRADTAMWLLGVGFLTVALPFQNLQCSGEAEENLNDFEARFEVPAAFTYAERLRTVQAFEAWVEAHKEEWGVRVYRSEMDSDTTRGDVQVALLQDGPLDRDEVLRRARESLPQLPGVSAAIGWNETGNGGGNSFSLVLRGEETEVLDRLAEEVERRIRAVPGVIGVDSEREGEGAKVMQLQVDRAATGRYGVSANAIGQVVSFAMRGAPLPSLQQGGAPIQVLSRFALEDRASVSKVLALTVPAWQAPSITGLSAGGVVQVPLERMVTPKLADSWGTIRRLNRQTALSLRVDVEEGEDAMALQGQVIQTLQEMQWPEGYGLDRGSEWEQQQASDRARNFAMLMSVVFVFLIMGMLFESFLLPLAVLTTLPMAAFGVTWGLWLTGTPFDLMAGVGMIILIGIVVNNGIVLIDVVKEKMAEGVPRDEALQTAVGVRLRPILMTALSAIVGVVPMAVGESTFVGIPYAPLGRVVGFGMLAATFLTLFFVPWLYAVLDDARTVGARWLAYVWAGPTVSDAREEA